MSPVGGPSHWHPEVQSRGGISNRSSRELVDTEDRPGGSGRNLARAPVPSRRPDAEGLLQRLVRRGRLAVCRIEQLVPVIVGLCVGQLLAALARAALQECFQLIAEVVDGAVLERERRPKRQRGR